MSTNAKPTRSDRALRGAFRTLAAQQTRGLSVLALLWLCCALCPRLAQAELNIDDTGYFVIDNANVVDADARARMEKLLKRLETKTGDQIKLLTIPSLEGEDIFPFTERHAERWKLGQKGKDNAALIVFSLTDRKVRIHTYYGLEGALPDSYLGSLIRQTGTTYFKQGYYSAGLERMVGTLVAKVAKEQGVSIDGADPLPVAAPESVTSGFFICLIFLVFFVVPIVWNLYHNRRRRRGSRTWGGPSVLPDLSSPWTPWIAGPSSGGRHSSGGGSFGGGSFGGGFGGGGGSFGGGGRTGGGGAQGGW